MLLSQSHHVNTYIEQRLSIYYTMSLHWIPHNPFAMIKSRSRNGTVWTTLYKLVAFYFLHHSKFPALLLWLHPLIKTSNYLLSQKPWFWKYLMSWLKTCWVHVRSYCSGDGQTTEGQRTDMFSFEYLWTFWHCGQLVWCKKYLLSLAELFAYFNCYNFPYEKGFFVF